MGQPLCSSPISSSSAFFGLNFWGAHRDALPWSSNRTDALATAKDSVQNLGMANEHLEEAAALTKNADQWIKDTRGRANAIQNQSVNFAVVKLFAIVEFQNQALEKLRLGIETKDTK